MEVEQESQSVSDEVNDSPSVEDLAIFSSYDNELKFPEFLEDGNAAILPEHTYAEIKRGNMKDVRKSSFCWFFNNHHKLSSDKTNTSKGITGVAKIC